MKKYQIVVAYDGTDYYGWQLQSTLPSITYKLQHSFYLIFGSRIKITGASRTDAGVHAHGQVAMFTTDLVIDSKRMLHAWNNRLSSDIVIRSLAVADPNFHPFYNVECKIYHYHIFLEQPLPFLQRFGAYYQKKIDLSMLKKALNVFVGTHDFTAFCAADVEAPSRVRTITSISLEYVQEWHAYRIIIVSSSFLRYMIRRIVGAAIKVATSDTMAVEYIEEILKAKNPNNPLPTAPAKGLTLHEVVYKKGKLFMMNKIMKKIVFVGVLLTAFGGGIWYYTSSVRTPISDFEFSRDTEPILEIFKEDWYWLDASHEQYAPEYILYKLKNRTPHINPLHTGSMRIKVLREKDQVVGFITYHKEGADSGRILYLGVKSEMRGKRYGEALARYALDDLISMGSKKIRLVTRTDNLAAQKLYNRLGFVETTRSDGFVNFEYTVK